MQEAQGTPPLSFVMCTSIGKYTRVVYNQYTATPYNNLRARWYLEIGIFAEIANLFFVRFFFCAVYCTTGI